MSKGADMNKKIIYHSLLAAGLFLTCLFASGSVFAAEYTLNGDYNINGGLSVRGDLYADHNVITFNHDGYSGADPTMSFRRGVSLFKEMGDMYIISDDYIHLGYTKSIMDQEGILIQNSAEITGKSRSAHGRLEAGTVQVNTLLTFAEGTT